MLYPQKSFIKTQLIPNKNMLYLRSSCIYYTAINKEVLNYMFKKLYFTLICMLCILMYSTTRVHADNSTTASTSTQSGWITSDGHQQWIDENG